MSYPALIYNLSRGTWSPAPASAASREAAEACEVSRSALPPYVLDIESDVRQAARQLGIGPPRIRYLPAETTGVRGVVFTPHHHEIWVKLQPKAEMRATALHELRHAWGLQDGGANYKALALHDMEARQRDADDFAATWRPTQFKRGDRLELKATDARTFEGYASRWDDVDYVGDRVQKGAFTDTLKARKARPLLWNHDMGAPIGVELALRENATGLLGTWRLSKTAAANDIYTLLKDGGVTGLSIGYVPKRATPNDAGGVDLFAVDLLEVSIVSIPALDSARIHSVKGMPAGTDVARELARRRRIFMGRRSGTGVRPR